MGVKIWLGICVVAIMIGVCAHMFAIKPNGIESSEETEETVQLQEQQEHDFVKGVWESPTCQKSGYYNNICRKCGLIECVTQAPLPHEVQDTVIQEGNCMEDTIIRHVCTACGMKVASDTRYTLKDAHNWATQLVDGTEMTYCTACGIAP